MRKIKTMLAVFRIFMKTIALLWKTSPVSFILILLIDFSSGLIIPAKLWVWKEVLDQIANIITQTSGSLGDIFIWLFIHFLLMLFGSLLKNISTYMQNIYSAVLNVTLTREILQKISLMSMEHFDNSETYNRIQKANDESLSRSISILQTLVAFIQNSTSLLGIVGILFYFSKSVVFLCIISAVPMFYISIKILNKWFDVFNGRFERNRFAKHLKSISIKNQNVKELKIYRSYAYLTGVILGTLNEYLTEDKKIRKRFLIETSLVEGLDQAILYFIKILVILISVQNKLTIGAITMYVTAVDNLKNSVSNILSLLSTAYEDSLYMQSIFELLEISTKEEQSDRGFPVGFQTIEFKDVSFCYPNTQQYVLKNINLRLEANQTYVLVGMNGSGKTTLIKLLLKLYQPTEGEILIDGVNINTLNQESYYKHVSAVFQDFIQYPFDIKTNIGLGNPDQVDDIKQIIEAAKLSGADSFISKLPEQYSTKLQKEWSGSIDLSLGQWQKVAITRAMMKSSAILILDEPSASLDVVAEHEIYERFQEMRRSKLCLMVTHRFVNTAVADGIIVLQSGEVIEEGKHTELMRRNGVYAQLYQLQAESYAI
ncbi:ABC transporter ATP-binding protein [Paenibacillus albidus]|uniref:ABC transporter ATP-binding protein n=1 Tax=Paenibacillus albidus TaxID=2041023 RepID=UPI001BEC34BE|nr:ABC transporter ATP-binding protein [Paenibacillus albidus]MBT2291990.1 ABC transporter ATP-binding protein [Paenibacillus albidus]